MCFKSISAVVVFIKKIAVNGFFKRNNTVKAVSFKTLFYFPFKNNYIYSVTGSSAYRAYFLLYEPCYGFKTSEKPDG